MEGLDPMVAAQIDGSDTRFILDSGAFYSFIYSASAARLKLPWLSSGEVEVHGTGGTEFARVTQVKNFALAGCTTSSSWSSPARLKAMLPDF
jgi:hypothetical protein